MMGSAANLKTDLIRQAHALGFDVCRIAPAPIDEATAVMGDRLHDFLAQDYHGDMDWLARHATRRAHPQNLWAEARSIIMVGLNYAPAHNPLAHRTQADKGLISVYAQRRDYHDVMKKKLRALASWVATQSGAEVKFFVDTAPVMEKPLAAAAGLGWQGKHTNLVSRDFGSWLFLGAIFTTYILPADTPHSDQCGSCRACLDICPTNAFPAPYKLDARRCISYLTIEHKGVIAEDLRARVGNYVYGCDDCLAVCPWNKFARKGREARLALRGDLNLPALRDLAVLDEAAFRSLFAGTPIKRVGRDRFLRNVLIAIGNMAGKVSYAEQAQTLKIVEARLADRSALVRGMAVWALARLDSARVRALAEDYLPRESDGHVRDEWQKVI